MTDPDINEPFSVHDRFVEAIARGHNVKASCWLRAQGVPLATIIDKCPVQIEDGFSIAFLDSGSVVAFEIAAPDRFRVWPANLWCIGEDQVSAALVHLSGQPLRVHRHPLAWLRSGGQGVVIVDERRAPHLLRQIPAIETEDPTHEREVRSMLDVRLRLPRVTVARAREAA